MKIYRSQNVYDAALERIRWVYDEFPTVICSVSGGKDSTAIFHLCLQVAREKRRLPLKVFWLDQEAEWKATVDQVTSWMRHPDVEPLWMQFPFKLFNATSTSEHWLYCWDPAKQTDWVHPQVDISYKVNNFGTDRFHQLFGAVVGRLFAGERVAMISGVRCEESPGRLMGLTYLPKYKWVTWGKRLAAKAEHYTFYPLYDWSYMDVWAAIAKHHWSYNRIYDLQYQYGMPVGKMRVSNVHHETSVYSLFYLQEVEPETYDRLVNRLSGIDMAGKLGVADYFIETLPFMFDSWREYRDYLLEHLIDREDWREKMRTVFIKHDAALGESMGRRKYQAHIQSILTHDWEGIKLDNFFRRPDTLNYHRRMKESHASV